jgi:hypothetical protein
MTITKIPYQKTVSELLKAVQLAKGAHYKAEDNRDKERSDRIETEAAPLFQQAETTKAKIIRETSLKHADGIEAARKAVLAAEAEYAKARAQDTGWFPVGTVVEEWERVGYLYRHADNPHHRKTGRRGVVRIWDNDSPRPDRTSYGQPDVGDVYVRLLKKDGSESVKYEQRNHYGRDCWFLEGIGADVVAKGWA